MKIFTLKRVSFGTLVCLLTYSPLSLFAQCGTTITTFPYAESFESPGIGAWTQGTGDNGNWTVATGGTPSGATGPSAASHLNYFIFTESSSGASPGSPNRTAFLDSPCLNLSGLANPEFTFDYHMFGGNMGTLKVQVSTNNGTTWTDIGWSQVGQNQTGHTAPWTSVLINLSAYSGLTIKLRLHGTTGSNYTSDMSVDNIVVQDAVAISCTSTVNTFPYNEGFEGTGSGGIGAWIQDTADNGDWTIRTGGTPSNTTGPSAAAEASYYLFTEASGTTNPGSPNRTAFINSPCFNLTGTSNPQFNFSYHMYGSGMGTLKVQVSTDNGATYSDIGWSRTGQQHILDTSPWTSATISLVSYIGQTVNLRFHGTTGADYRSDMAIDGISLTDSAATTEIDVLGSGISITDGDNTPSTADDTDFGTVNVGAPTPHTFTINNLGSLPLTVGTVTIGGTNAAEFVLTSAPATTVTGGGSTTFTVVFTAGGTGLRTATISIINNDSNENPYNFSIQGTGITGPPKYTAYYETFDTNNGGWSPVTSTGDSWTWTNSFPVAEIAEGSFWRNNSYNDYPSNTNIVVQSPQYDFSDLQNLQLSLDVKYKTQNNQDGMRILYSVAGGAYTLLGASGSGVGWYEGNVGALGSDGWMDDSHPTATAFTHNKFKRATLPLSDATFAGQNNVRFRIQFSSNTSNNDDGVAFDNFMIEADPTSTLNNPTNAPANVASNLRIWLRSDAGIAASDGANLTLWEDYAYDTTLDKEDATAGSAIAPTYRNNINNNINFNPVAQFDSSTTEYMNGKGGFYAQDYFAVVFSDDVVDTSTGPYSPGRQFAIGGRFADADFHEDPTGLGMGSVSARYSNEVIAHTINSFNNSGAPDFDQYGRAYTSSSNSFNHVMIVNVKSNTSGTQTEIYKNGKQIDNTAGLSGDGSLLPFYEFNNLPYLLGAGRSGLAGRTTSQLNGRLSEVISYEAANSALNQQKIQSYLGLKFGITLQAPGSALTDHQLNDVDYIDSNGNVIWDTSANAGYNYDIAGIGRDDNSDLNQKQSKSVNTGSVVSIGLSTIALTNSDNSSSFTTDTDFLVWGNNGGDMMVSGTPIDVDLGPTTVTTITDVTNRKWKIVETGGDVATVKVSVFESDLTGLPALVGNDAYVLVLADDAAFSSNVETVFLQPSTFNGQPTHEITYDFDNTRFFTLGVAHEVIEPRHLEFDGVDNYTRVGDKLDLTGSFTTSAWVRTTGSNSTNSDQTIIAKHNGSLGYKFTVRNDRTIRFSTGPLAVSRIDSNVSITANTWHHVAVTYNGTTANLYIDGVLDRTLPLVSPGNTASEFSIGAVYENKNSIEDYFNGDIDEVKIFDSVLTVDQIRYMMNQEIERSGSNVNGLIVPNTIAKNDISALNWGNILAYYSMNTYIGTHLNDVSGNGNRASLIVPNRFSIEVQTAPLPYISSGNGTWTNNSTWTYGSEQYIPGSTSIVDSDVTIDWNIVRTLHNVSMDNSSLPAGKLENRTLLGLFVDANELTVDSDYGLTVSHYLKLDGTIDLDGESQLIQDTDSELDVTSSGNLERDQQGTADTYTYNYWSSPVSTINTTANNQNYTIPNMLRDGTTAATPGTINFLTAVYNGTNTNPIGIADYWLWKFANGPDDDYSFWQHVRSTGTMQVGEGYTMKGPGTGTIATPQNYVFTGKPNNADISLNITSGNDYLVGNPYPSAIDAHEFLDDNPLTGGTLYFWEHWGGGSHNLGDYQGGYAMYNYSGGTGAGSFGTNDPDVGTGGTPTKLPGQFIPVAQGFFVVANTTGTVNFENDQRVFVKESGSSVFVRTSGDQTTQTTDTRMKFRIGLNSINQIHRQLLLTVDDNATSSVDWGYDGEIHEEQMDDMYWMIEGNKYVIQGTNLVDYTTVAPVGIHTRDEGMNTITIDSLENVPDDVFVYVYDKLLNIHHNLRESDYQVFLTAGEHFDRFEIVFNDTPPILGVNDDELADTFQVYYSNADESIVIVNPENTPIENVELFNILGQSIKSFDDIPNQLNTQIKITNLSTGTYIVKLNTEDGSLSKQVLVK